MDPDVIPRKLNERSERHRCIRCLREVEQEEYFHNDFVCDECAAALSGGTMNEETMNDGHASGQ
ncbi:MAG TPA: hypothetical protein VKH35_16805 [Thermoanaerobaculia bacterium]|jgi:ribosomal protein L37AE/L43A|nr:hypothetical protein [Thermoanaerobaculia bacterium]